MGKICGNCEASLQEGVGFCGSCGAGIQRQINPAQQPAFQPVAQAAAPTAPTPAVAVGKSSSPWLKVFLAAFAVVFVCGAVVVGGIVYVAHKVSQKAHEYSHEVLEETDSTTPAGGSPITANPAGMVTSVAGDPCLLLSKQDVSQAIGVPIVETSPADGGCSYLAMGTPADMAAKHAAAMIAAEGADKKTQGIFEHFAGGVLNNIPKTATSDTESAGGNVVVFTFGVDTNSAKEQMHLNSKVLGGLGSTAQQPLDGIGDEAFAEADSMMMVRKGDKLIRILYTSCPCDTEAIKPLAKQLAARL